MSIEDPRGSSEERRMGMNSKKLELRYLTSDKGRMSISVADPKDGLALAEVKTAAEAIRPVLKSARGILAASFDKAYVIETTVTEVQ